jgi:hypothetical protein
MQVNVGSDFSTGIRNRLMQQVANYKKCSILPVFFSPYHAS